MQYILKYVPIPNYRGGMGVMLNIMIHHMSVVGSDVYFDWTDDNIVYKDKEIGENVWDYYYYNNPLREDSVLFDFQPDGHWFYKYHIDINKDAVISKDKIKLMSDIFYKNIRIKEPILEDLETFLKDNIKGRSLGIQYRKTDKVREVHQISIDRFVEVVKEQIDKYDTIFIASDETDAVERTKNLSDKIKYLDIIRCSDGTGLHYQINDRKHDNYLRGYECLMDMLILSRCTDFLFSRSNVSETVLVMNDLKFENTFILNNF